MQAMKIIRMTWSIGVGVLLYAGIASCGNNSSKPETKEDTTPSPGVASPEDTFIRSDGDPRYQGIQGPQPFDSVRVQRPDTGSGR